MQTYIKTEFLIIKKWSTRLPELKCRYQNSSPYPNVILEGFLDNDVLESALAELETIGKSEAWISYVHFNENKKGLNEIDGLPAHLQRVIRQHNNPDFVQFLGELPGIRKSDG